ncbi:MAG: NADH-quinone oxidoreductase subunit J [Phycisphaerales bacterium]|nr:MAG: NADH-quinone oxidoreductase subunit J [Phycisphaerales bacterium]
MTSALPQHAYALYAIFALGALGLYCLLPRTERARTIPGIVIGSSALIGLLLFLGIRIASPTSASVYFCIFSALAILGGVRVITHPKPVYSAVYFVLVVVAVAAMLILLQAEFLAAALIIIYAGAILVTYVFVIMLAQQSGRPTYDRRAREPFAAVLAGFILMAAVAGQVSTLPGSQDATSRSARMASDESLPAAADESADPLKGSNTAGMGVLLMTKYVIALEIAGLLLLISMVGAIALSKKRAASERIEEEARPIGQIGKEVKPF